MKCAPARLDTMELSSLKDNYHHNVSVSARMNNSRFIVFFKQSLVTKYGHRLHSGFTFQVTCFGNTSIQRNHAYKVPNLQLLFRINIWVLGVLIEWKDSNFRV